jgi:hypothetical protein
MSMHLDAIDLLEHDHRIVETGCEGGRSHEH